MNPYQVLGVQKTADQDEIKRAFKKLAKKYHPDVNKSADAEKHFKEVNAAYDVVGDPEKRKLYDEFGEASLKTGFNPEQARAWSQGGFGGGFPGGGFPGAGFPGGSPRGGRFRAGGVEFDFGGAGFDMDDILGSMFGDDARQGGRGRARRGRDQAARLIVDPMTSFVGGEVKLGLQRPNGSTETLTVRVPPGARNGGKLRLPGQGLPPPGGGPTGDLIVTLDIPDHPRLRRNEDDLEMDVPITVLEALEGARITVPTPTGDVKVTVPAKVESGRKLRIKGRGVQRKGNPGDLYLVLRPEAPRSEEQAVLDAARSMEAAYGPEGVRGSLKL